ncbi:hypothetical protein SUNI508_05395 [Seiridium unicorne]|uniref:Uncharacterized protein n=1 Tax=Seiridium unicorne TaxID=138068 RepID=A0ABR2V4R5_9PEZI
MQMIENSTKFGGFSPELPLLATILQYVPIRTIQDFVNADNECKGSPRRRCVESAIPVSRESMFSWVVAENEKENATLTDYQVAFGAAGFIVAGPGTTAVTFIYIIGAILLNRAIPAKLEAEVEALPEPYTD